MPVAEFPVCAPSDRRYGAATVACVCGSGILGAVARSPESPASELNGVGPQTGSRLGDAGLELGSYDPPDTLLRRVIHSGGVSCAAPARRWAR
jgi:hypothetical protein